MVFALAACGGDTEPAPSGDGAADPGVSEQQPSDTPDDAAPPADSDEWPDNEFTSLLPEFPFTVTSYSEDTFDDGTTMRVNFAGATFDELKAYETALSEGGFNVNMRGNLEDNGDDYFLTVDNEEGWTVEINYGVNIDSGQMYITKP
ncbi:MAG: hypothetical protein Q4B48_06925, partial [Syntrophomonadaceae bacterium]|nr:hypothetical protein [Syntrophomonadaceae bacterium]